MGFELDTNQNRVANHINGPLLTLAGPGSGKTQTIIQRAINMIKVGHKPENHLLLTFSKKACDEMAARMISEVETVPVIRTFHAFAFQFIRHTPKRFGYEYGVRIINTNESLSLILKIAENTLRGFKKKDGKILLRFLDYIKCHGINVTYEDFYSRINQHLANFTELDNYDLQTVYKHYELEKKQINAIDFSDCLPILNDYMNFDTEFRERVRKRFTHLTVDELQDTDWIQYQILKKLYNGNIVGVGDDDQSIYAFRGTQPGLLKDFKTDFKPKVVYLERNYRCSPHIVKCASSLIQNNAHRIPKPAYSTTGYNSSKPERYLCLTHKGLTKELLNNIQTDLNSGIRPDQIAVLYRNNFMLTYATQVLKFDNLPFQVLGGESKEMHSIIQTVGCIFSLLIHTGDVLSFKTIAKFYKIQSADLSKIARLCREKQLSVWDAAYHINTPRINIMCDSILQFLNNLSHCQVENMFDYIRHHYLFKTWVFGTNPKPSFGQIEALNTCEHIISDSIFGTEGKAQIVQRVVDAFFSYEQRDTGSESGIVLGTCHKAKGLQYRSVHVIGFSESIFPSYSSNRPITDKLLSEERRLAFVTATRAQEQLSLYHSGTMITNSYMIRGLQPSRFFNEMHFNNV